MALYLVPYTNAMRLGQGFNSYTQQICVDDAVVIDNDRAENTLLNDGTTMRILVQSQSKASAWTRQKEVVVDDRTENINREYRKALPDVDLEEEETEPVLNASTDDTVKNVAAQEEDNQGQAESDQSVEPGAEVAFEGEAAEGEPETVAEEPMRSASWEDVGSIPSPSHPLISMEDAKNTRASSSATKIDQIKTQRPPRFNSAGGATTNLARTKSFPGTKNKPSPAPVKPSVRTSAVWTKLRRDLAIQKAAALKAEEEEKEAIYLAEKERIGELREYQKEIERETREEDRKRRAEDREEQRRIRDEKRRFEEQRRKDMYKSINDAATAKNKALTIAEMQAILKQNQFAERWDGLGENSQVYTFDSNAPRGPSQTVTYTSRFIDRLSDITDDMCISGALSIKAAKIGGSGRGSFIDSDKFKDSDLTFYISVKVVNQTINFKDALQFHSMKGVTKETFPKVYGDSFISGFQEGGEFNALVSMKILNKAKRSDIQAEAKVAFTAGPMSVEAEANVGIARENIESNTETTIQVSWCGGGHIKPMEQQWDIKSLMAAASRFPDLVADCPQRTHAILTKYDSLRSFVERQPKAYTKLQYENAQIYTNVLMDAFMSYKALYKQISDQMFQVRQKTMEIVSWEKKDTADSATKNADNAGVSSTTPEKAKKSALSAAGKIKKNGFYPYFEDNSLFEATIGGLDEARKAIRRQMSRIVNEVNEIEVDPTLATDEDHEEPFHSPASFEMRLPTVDIPERLRPKENPLTGQRILAKTQTEEERKKEAKTLEDLDKAPALYSEDTTVQPDEASVFAKFIELDPSVGQHLNITAAVGDSSYGEAFNHLDFVRGEWHIKRITVRHTEGMIRSMAIEYHNGLTTFQGMRVDHGKVYELTSFTPGERIISCSIETGTYTTNALILGLRIFTNRGRSLCAEAQQSIPSGNKSAIKDGFAYEDINVTHVDCPFTQGTLKGIFGRHKDDGGLYRLGFIWGDILPESSSGFGSSAVQKVERKILPSKWGQTASGNIAAGGSCTLTAKFGITYPQIPKVITAFSEVRGVSSDRPISWNQSSIDVTKESFVYTAALFEPFQQLAYSWLALPDNEVNFQTGSHDFESEVTDGVENAVGTYQVTFNPPYKVTPATPAIWCQTLDYTGCGKVGDARTRARVEELSVTGFKLVVETWGGSKHAGNVWGWCVWDNEFDGVKVKTGSYSVTNPDLVRGHMQYWEPDFGLGAGKLPVSIMTGIKGLDVNVSDGGRFHVKSQFQGTLENGGISFGTDAFTQSRWVEAMYVAIIED